MMTTQERLSTIQKRLTEALQPESLEIIDDRQDHAGHGPAEAGAGYFTVRIISKAFVGQNLPGRHRMVYSALGDLMKEEIHALSIHAEAP